jgi:hypothetical protein
MAIKGSGPFIYLAHKYLPRACWVLNCQEQITQENKIQVLYLLLCTVGTGEPSIHQKSQICTWYIFLKKYFYFIFLKSYVMKDI